MFLADTDTSDILWEALVSLINNMHLEITL